MIENSLEMFDGDGLSIAIETEASIRERYDGDGYGDGYGDGDGPGDGNGNGDVYQLTRLFKYQ